MIIVIAPEHSQNPGMKFFLPDSARCIRIRNLTPEEEEELQDTGEVIFPKSRRSQLSAIHPGETVLLREEGSQSWVPYEVDRKVHSPSPTSKAKH